MAISCRYYIQRLGVFGIVRISTRWWEETRGFQNEHTVEEVACIKDGKPCRLKVHWISKTMGALDSHVDEETEIAGDEYERLREKHGGILDTTEYLRRLTEGSRLMKEIDALKPVCPECKAPMEIRWGRYGKFWGCSRYPSCKGTAKVNESEKEKLDRLYEDLKDVPTGTYDD